MVGTDTCYCYFPFHLLPSLFYNHLNLDLNNGVSEGPIHWGQLALLVTADLPKKFCAVPLGAPLLTVVLKPMLGALGAELLCLWLVFTWVLFFLPPSPSPGRWCLFVQSEVSPGGKANHPSAVEFIANMATQHSCFSFLGSELQAFRVCTGLP